MTAAPAGREPWSLPVGERLTPERAGAIVARFGAEVRAIGEEVAARRRAERPGREVRGRVYGTALVLEAFQIGRSADEAPRWLWKEFFNVRNPREQRAPVLGFTWFSLTDQVDWDSALVLERGVVNPLGLYDLGRRPRPVAAAYKELVHRFAAEPLLPYGSAFGFDRAGEPAAGVPRA